MTSVSRVRPTGTIREKLTALLVEELRELAGAAGERLASAVVDGVGSLTERLTEYAAGSGDPRQVAAAAAAGKLAEGRSPVSALVSAATSGAKERLKQAVGGGGKGGKGGKGKLKVTNIVEAVDVGVPVRVAYNQWTQFEDFPGFMKKVENVERESDQKLTWRAQILWSHRSWESTIVEQVPDERIVWRSTGQKGSVDGAVSFHAVTPNLTRILLVLEYHPQGFFEHTGNIWRAPGRRARLELKHFVRHVMTQTALSPDEVEGWRGEIRDGEVVRDHESARAQEQEPEQEPEPGAKQEPEPDEEQEPEPDEEQEPESEQEPERPGGRQPSRARDGQSGRRPARARRPAPTER
jgi:uncharacterized membrane protein